MQTRTMSSHTLTQKAALVSIVIPTHNAARRTLATANAMLSAAQETRMAVEVVIVDDGSDDANRAVLRSAANPDIRVVHAKQNRGRGAAVNLGAGEANGEFLLVVDCDCPPASSDFFHNHMAEIDAGADVSIGRLQRRANDFWGRYQDRAVLRRERQFVAGTAFAFTSQNVLLATEWFRRIGGFDEAYSRYGFEDRDFFIRLAAAGARIHYSPGAAVIHDDDNIRLGSIMPKMRDAGEFTSTYFRQCHPEEYRQLGYAALDVRSRHWLSPVGSWLGQAAMSLGPRLDPWLPRLPFPVAAMLAKGLTALAYMHGTSRPGLGARQNGVTPTTSS